MVRVIGRIGSEGEVYTYGVAFVDHSNIDFWGIDFSPVSEREKQARRMLLECGNCKEREIVEHSDVESDVFLINEGIVRYCKQCGDSTLWKRSSEVTEEQPVLVGAGPAASAPRPRKRTTALVHKLLELQGLPNRTSSVHSAAFSWLANSLGVFFPDGPQAAVPLDNRRKHPRTKVSYKASIRRSGFPDDTVTCEDMSKGGLCFKSRKQYFKGTDVEVAVPYSPGGNAIYVPAQIAWVVEITKDKLYKCGASYRRTSRAS